MRMRQTYLIVQLVQPLLRFRFLPLELLVGGCYSVKFFLKRLHLAVTNAYVGFLLLLICFQSDLLSKRVPSKSGKHDRMQPTRRKRHGSLLKRVGIKESLEQQAQ